jgi:hypothetical protein
LDDPLDRALEAAVALENRRIDLMRRWLHHARRAKLTALERRKVLAGLERATGGEELARVVPGPLAPAPPTAPVGALSLENALLSEFDDVLGGVYVGSSIEDSLTIAVTGRAPAVSRAVRQRFENDLAFELIAARRTLHELAELERTVRGAAADVRARGLAIRRIQIARDRNGVEVGVSVDPEAAERFLRRRFGTSAIHTVVAETVYLS